MTTLYHLHLTVNSPQGTFEGLLTDAPVELDAASQACAQYSAMILQAESIQMVAVGQGQKSTMVVPADVIRKSVLVFQIKPVDAPLPDMAPVES